MSTRFEIEVRSTSISVYPGNEATLLLEPLLELMTYEDEFVDETRVLGYIYDDEVDKIYFHKGVDLDYLRRLLGNATVKMIPPDKNKSMEFEYDEIVPPRDDEQKDVIDFISGMGYHSSNVKNNQLFLIKKPGFGKAEPYTRRIPTPTPKGFTLMGNLKIGDYVFDINGEPTRVVEIFDQGYKRVYDITFEDGRVARCCDEHLWPIFIDQHNFYAVHSLHKIRKLIKRHEIYIPLCDPVQYFDKLHFTDVENIIQDMYTNTLEPSYLNILLTSSVKIRLDFVNVLNEYACKVNKKYQNGVEQIVYSLGMTCYFDAFGIFYLQKPERLRIKSIKRSTKEPCRCIRVSNSDHLYLTEDFIVTHNTYCSGVGMCKYNTKTLIITHRDNLRDQWTSSLYKMNGMNEQYVHVIRDSQELYDIAHNNIEKEYDVYLITHATLRAGLKRIAHFSDAQKISKNLHIGLKIIDEAHLEFRNTIMVDCMCNVQRNVYLTATGGRSSKEENSIFKHVFSNAVYYKPSALLKESNTPKKWVNYTIIGLNTHCKPNIYRYKVAGGRGMNPASYGKWVIANDKNNTHFKCCVELLKLIYENDRYAKVLIFMPLIDLCQECVYFLTRNLDYDPTFQYSLSIRTINSSNSKTDNEYNRKADVIVTTIQSCGTGTDISGITAIISCSPFVSKITAEQVFGRIRYCGKVCDYFDVYDESVLMDKFWLRSRSKKLKQLALNTRVLQYNDNNSQEKQ